MLVMQDKLDHMVVGRTVIDHMLVALGILVVSDTLRPLQVALYMISFHFSLLLEGYIPGGACLACCTAQT